MSTQQFSFDEHTEYVDAYHQYLADISSCERNTDEQDTALLYQLDRVKRGELPPTAGEQIVQRLIEGSLYRVMRIASNYHRHLVTVSGGRTSVDVMDLVQVANETLIKCAHHCLDTEETPDNFGAYTGKSVSGAVRTYRIEDCPVSVSSRDWHQKAQEEKLADLYEVFSLDDSPLEDGEPLAERLEAPVPTPIRPDKQQKVDMLLQVFPEQEQRLLRLRYGLDLNDQHEHTYEEIAQCIGLGRQDCWRREQRLLQTLREQVPYHNSPDYYRLSEAATVLGVCNQTLCDYVEKGIIQRYYPVGCDVIGVYSKAQIDGLAEYIQQIDQNYYTRQEAANRLGIDRSTIRKWARRGKITEYHFPQQGDGRARYLKADVEALVQQKKPLPLYRTLPEREIMYA